MRYLKNGKECLLCHTRKKLIQVTPEEIVRQNHIASLIEVFKVPRHLIESEVPMSHFGKGFSGRADIIVYDYDDAEHVNYPLILVECKAPNIPLTDNVFNQACDYNDVIGAKLIVLTNGLESVYAMWDDDAQEYFEIESMPNYQDLLLQKNIKITEQLPYKKINYLDTDHNLVEEGVIGEDTHVDFHPFLINLHGLITDETDTVKHIPLENYKFLKDGGLRFTTFGNSAGGGFTGDYRYFIIEDDNNDTQIISVSLMGKLSAKNHPRFGNSIGYTLLLVAIDDYEQSHLSLELSLDRFTNVQDNVYEIYHDGTLTVGNKGRVKNAEVIEYVSVHNPKLIRDEKIFLGKLDNSKEFTWDRPDVVTFFKNVIEYALIRDQFRKSKRLNSV